MTRKPRKLEPPLYLDMSPDEALRRFLQTDPAEVEELEKQKEAAKRKPGGPLEPKSASDPTGGSG